MPHRALCEHPFRVARLVIIRPALLCRAAMSKFARAALAIRKQFSRRLADNALLPSCILSPRAMPHSALCADHAACDDAACTAGPRHSVKRCSRRVSPCLVSRFSAGNASLPRCPPSPNRFLQRRGVLPFPTLPSARRVLCLMNLFMCSFCLSFFWEGIWGCLVQSCTSPGSSLTPKVLFAPQQNKERQIQSLII